MGPDPIAIAGAPRTVVLGGEACRIHPLTAADWFGDFQDWIDRQRPDPFDIVNKEIERGRLVTRGGAAAREPYTIAQQQHLYRTAQELAARDRVLVGTPEATVLMQSFAGLMHLLYLSIRKGRPEFTEEDARRLVARMTFVEMARVFEATQADMVATDPKAGAGEAPTSTHHGATTPSSDGGTTARPPTGGAC